jgi:signal transduction histidine kinase
VSPLIGVLFYDPAVADDCAECPSNPLQIWDDPDAYDIGSGISSVLAAVVLGALIWHLVRRWRDADDPAERVRDAPVWWAGATTLVLVLVLLGTNLGPEEGNFDDWMFAASLLVLATLPYAFWLGALRSRLWEAGVVADENLRLDAELQRRLDELRESRARIVEAGYAERKRVERDLHDGAQQRLVALSLELSLLGGELAEETEAKERLTRARREIAASLAELREIAHGIHPAVVTGHGLDVALEQLAALASVPVRLTVETNGRLPEAIEVAAYYLVCETLANVGKYAEASSVTVDVSRSNGSVVVQVVDDGVGGADTERGTGLRGVADRIEALDGRVRVWSPAGGGTRIQAEIPCAL